MPQKTIILVNPVFEFEKHLVQRALKRRSKKRSYPPLGLLQIGGVLKANGYNVIILDANIETNPFSFVDEIMHKHDVFLVGFTVKVGPPLLFAMQLSYYIKRNYPEITIVWGGVLPTVLPGQTLRQSFADYAIIDQGEESLLALCDAILAGNKSLEIPGVAYLKDKTFCITPQKPFTKHYCADWSLLEGKLTTEQHPYLAALLLSKGCPFRCSFCYHQAEPEIRNINSNKWIPRNDETVLTDIDALRSFGMNVFTFLDDCTLLNKKRILPLINSFKERNIYIEQCISHISTINKEVIEAIAPIVQQIAFSIETVSPKLQEVLNKKISFEEILTADKLLAEHDINTIHNFIVAIPGESDEDLRMNIEVAAKLREINPFIRFTAIFCIPYPKTDLEKWLKASHNLSIPYDLRLLSTADLYNLEINPVLQPWIIDPEQKRFYSDFMILFDSLFSRWQHQVGLQVESLLKKKRFARIFEPALNMPVPHDAFPYILDWTLKNPEAQYPSAKRKFLSGD